MSILDRAWTRRGLVGPAHFGRTLSGVWLDTFVSFSRLRVHDDGYGGFSATTPETYLATKAHVTFGDPTGPYQFSGQMPPLDKRRTRVRIPYPHDAEQVPIKGDTLIWDTPTGERLRLAVRNVVSPRGWADHILVEAEEFS
jgi:hypothetical protein